MTDLINTGFNEWELLQQVLIQIQNRIVREEFSDIDGDDDRPITTSRAKLKSVCLLKDADSAAVTLNKLMLYYIILRKAQDLQIPVYGIPIPEFQESHKFKPQVRLCFMQDLDSVADNDSPVTAEISFRIPNETSQTITEAELRSLATRIKAEFGAGGGYRWRKGRLKATYKDTKNGFWMILSIYSEAEAKEVIGKVLSVRSKNPDWDYLTISESKKTFPTTPGTQVILGKSRRKPKERPIAYVRFIYASAAVWGLPNDVILYDRTGNRRNTLIN